MIYIDSTALEPVPDSRRAPAGSLGAMVMLDGEEYLTVDEAAQLLGVKRATLYAYVSRGVLKSYRQGIKRSVSTAAPRSRRWSGAERGRRTAPEIPLAESWIRD